MMAQDLQELLHIPRDLARNLGIETVNILDAGSYFSSIGKRIDIHEQVIRSCQGTVTYKPEDQLPTANIGPYETRVEIFNGTTLSAARGLIAEGYKPAVLNMASATSPGGGFLSGSRAQEEYLARSSALFACLKGNPMYDHHGFHRNPFYDDYVIYSPDVIVFRDDKGQLMDTPYCCSIITSPAVHAKAVRRYQLGRVKEIPGFMWKRILKVLSVAQIHGHQAIVLGAWGCGAFGNDPKQVGELFYRAIHQNFKGAFEMIVFAIADWSDNKKTIGPFEDIFLN